MRRLSGLIVMLALTAAIVAPGATPAAADGTSSCAFGPQVGILIKKSLYVNGRPTPLPLQAQHASLTVADGVMTVAVSLAPPAPAATGPTWAVVDPSVLVEIADATGRMRLQIRWDGGSVKQDVKAYGMDPYVRTRVVPGARAERLVDSVVLTVPIAGLGIDVPPDFRWLVAFLQLAFSAGKRTSMGMSETYCPAAAAREREPSQYPIADLAPPPTEPTVPTEG